MFTVFTLKVEANLGHSGRGAPAYTIDALRDDMPGPTTLGSLASLESVSALLGLIAEFLADGFACEQTRDGPRYTPRPDPWEPAAPNAMQVEREVRMVNQVSTIYCRATFASPQEALAAKRIMTSLLQHTLGFRRDSTRVIPAAAGAGSLSRTNPPRLSLAQAAAAAGTADEPERNSEIDFGDTDDPKHQ